MNSTRKKQDQQLAVVTQLKHDMENKVFSLHLACLWLLINLWHQVWQMEIAIEKKFAELEQTVQGYNKYAEKLHLTGPGAKVSQV